MGKKARRPRPVQQERPPAGAHLGDFGTKRAGLDYTFGWFGAQMRVNPDFTGLREVDFMERAVDIGSEDPRALLLIKDQLRLFVHPDDFTQFWSAAVDNGQEVDDLMAFMRSLVEALAGGRPTGRSGDSSPGPKTTPQKSESEPESEPDTVMRNLAGRPDLQLAVIRADRERELTG